MATLGIVQLFIIAFGLFALGRVFLNFRAKKISLSKFLLWIIIWIVLIVLAIMPGISSKLSDLVGIGRGTDLVIYLSIIALFYLMYHLHTRLDRIETEITNLVRNIAIERPAQKKKRNSK